MNALFIKAMSIVGFSFWSALAMAAEQSNDTLAAKTLTSSPVSRGALLETLFGLFVVLACIAFLAWLLRRTGRFQATANGEMKIITSLALGPRERAVLLQVGEQQILVGVTSQNVQTLHILETPVNNSTIKSSSNTSFSEKLQQIMQQKDKS
jgi:flagellar protein FliO/FliZ